MWWGIEGPLGAQFSEASRRQGPSVDGGLK
jgi:hypothetical protein